MLSVRYAAVVVLAVGIGLAVPTAAHADHFGDASCSASTPRPGCDITAGTPGQSARPTSGGRTSDGKCHNPSGAVIPCERNGGWAGSDGCYYQPLNPSPATIAALGGQPAGAGGWYQRICYTDTGATTQSLGGPTWIAGGPPVLSPAVLARQARARLNLPNVVIRLNPSGTQLVNLPIWLILERSSWTAQSATASVPGVSVTATARPVKATWSMGDGSTVVCAGPGTAWKPGTDPATASPDCGYTYRRSSAGASGARFTITVTVAWIVTWAGGGESGTIPGLTTAGTLRVPVQESQAVIS
jgi:hypothetical protein